MTDTSFLHWPFFEPHHRELADTVEAFAQQYCQQHDDTDVDAACRLLVKQLGDAQLLHHSAVDPNVPDETLDVRGLCIIRETLARHLGLADFSFAMQGLGSAPVALFGSDSLKQQYLPGVRDGSKIAAFALSEPEAGSDVAAMATRAERHDDAIVLNGRKSWISNGGIADFYTVFARTGEADGARGLSAFVVDADTPGFSVTERIQLMAPHPLAVLEFNDCRIDPAQQLGQGGDGFRIAMSTLDIFRSTVGAAALGFARRALDETLTHTASRQLFGAPLSAMQMTQAKLADMATAIDASALLVYRAAWTKDCIANRVTREAAMAKLYATESAQTVIDQAVQLFGGRGVVSGHIAERLYRDIRALRIYEGASEVQQQIIARQLLQTVKE